MGLGSVPIAVEQERHSFAAVGSESMGSPDVGADRARIGKSPELERGRRPDIVAAADIVA